jgi:general secretion pathway protein L
MERIAPWRAADALFSVRATPLDGDPTRLAIDVAIVPKRRIEPILTMIRPLDPVRVRLSAKGTDGGPVFDVTIGEDADRRLHKARRRTGFVLAGVSAGLLAAAAGLWLGWSLLSDAIADLDQAIAQRKAALMQARRLSDGGGPEASLKKLRAAQPYAARIVDTLAATLPDSTFLTELTIAKDRLHIVGISRDPNWCRRWNNPAPSPR